jgi:hypothetical protein
MHIHMTRLVHLGDDKFSFSGNLCLCVCSMCSEHTHEQIHTSAHASMKCALCCAYSVTASESIPCFNVVQSEVCMQHGIAHVIQKISSTTNRAFRFGTSTTLGQFLQSCLPLCKHVHMSVNTHAFHTHVYFDACVCACFTCKQVHVCV